jgi:hypothetical protein
LATEVEQIRYKAAVPGRKYRITWKLSDGTELLWIAMLVTTFLGYLLLQRL